MRSPNPWPGALLLVLIVVTAFGASVGHGASVTVPCDVNALIDAINTANTSPQPTTLELTAGCQYLLDQINNEAEKGDNGLPQIMAGHDITINAHGSSIVRKNHNTVGQSELISPSEDAGYAGADQVANAEAGDPPMYRIFQINAGAKLTLTGAKLANGLNWKSMAAEEGGAIANWGALKVADSVFVNNVAGCGGAIFHEGESLQVIRTTFLNNSGER